jgi:hypothetical protein
MQERIVLSPGLMGFGMCEAGIPGRHWFGGGRNYRFVRGSSTALFSSAAYDRRLVDYLRVQTVMSYGTFLDAGLHVSSDLIAKS